MYNFGGEIILESHRIPWLIWIQLIVLLLILLLLSYFGLFSLESDAAAVSSPPLKISSVIVHQEAGGSRETQRERARARERERVTEINAESSESSQKDLQRFLHPCFYLDLAKKAFFQCLGLNYTPPNPRESEDEETE